MCRYNIALGRVPPNSVNPADPVKPADATKHGLPTWVDSRVRQYNFAVGVTATEADYTHREDLVNLHTERFRSYLHNAIHRDFGPGRRDAGPYYNLDYQLDVIQGTTSPGRPQQARVYPGPQGEAMFRINWNLPPAPVSQL